jgi:hypothetical protein
MTERSDYHNSSIFNSQFSAPGGSGLRVRAKINSQILSVEAPAGQGAKEQAYQEYSELSQRRQAGCIGA